MSSHTRVFRPLGGPPAGRPQSGIGTVVFGAPPPPRDGVKEAWLRLHRAVRSACLEQPRAGAFLFAAQAAGGSVGRLWLAATATPRAGTLGRHEAVELPITTDAALSLRHVLFLVRLVRGRVRFTALDLESRSGLHTQAGQQRQLEAEQPAVFRAAGLAFFCVPTGPGTVLSADPLEAWERLARPPAPRGASFLERFLAAEPRAVGALTVQLGAQRLALRLDQATLERGVSLGRDARCDVVLPHHETSRVHAVAVQLDGAPYLVDVGSQNGTWTSRGERVRCAALRPGDEYLLGGAQLRWDDAEQPPAPPAREPHPSVSH